MIHIVLSGKGDEPIPTTIASAAQLRREAAKARKFAEGAFSQDEQRRLIEVAATLDREAAAIEAAIRLRSGRS